MTRIGRRHLLQLAGGIILLGLLTTGAAVYHHKAKPNHFLVVTPGTLYRSGVLRPANLERVIDRHGIRTVVNLIHSERTATGEWHREEARISRERGVALIDLSLPEETPPRPDQLATWLALLDDEERHPILVHCEHGVVRTGMMVAVYEMEFLRSPNQEVLETLPMFGHRLYTERRRPMREFILNYIPRWRSAEPGQRATTRPARM